MDDTPGGDVKDESTKVCIRSDPQELPQVRKAVERAASEAGFGGDEIGTIVLAVDEAIANVIKHGYQGRCDQPVEVHLGLIRENGRPGISLIVRDYGRQVAPDAICGRDLEDVRPGGLGVHIIRTVMDRVSYAPAEGGGMRLEMVKINKS